jgi:RHS repeat-associated protein
VFDPFGREVTIAGLAAMPLRFPGQYADPETGYSYNYFRDYDPRIGRYLQSDPIELYGGLNLYSYAENNPVVNFDLYGLDSSNCITAGMFIGAPLCPIVAKDCSRLPHRIAVGVCAVAATGGCIAILYFWLRDYYCAEDKKVACTTSSGRQPSLS